MATLQELAHVLERTYEFTGFWLHKEEKSRAQDETFDYS